MFWDAIKAALSGIFQGFLGMFGMSDAQKLGRAEVTLSDEKAQLKTEKEALDAQGKVDGMSDGAVNDELRSKWERK